MTLHLRAHLDLPGGHLDLDITDVDLATLDPDRRTAVLAGLTQVATAVLGTRQTPAKPTRLAPAPPAQARPVTPAPAQPSTAPKPLRTRRGEHATPGSCEHAILTAVAEAGGRWSGSLMALARDHGTGTASGSIQTARRAAVGGHLRLHRTGPRTVVAVYLTDAGWQRLGLTPPPAPTEPDPSPEPDDTPEAPAMPDLGPIEKRPFDPERARASAGEGVGW